MAKPSRGSIIEAYNELVASTGEQMGEKRFMRETGIPRYYWRGGYWRSWAAFQADAGHQPNRPTPRINDELVLERFSEFVLQRGALPTEADILLEKANDPSFPGKDVLRRWGGRDALLAKVAEFCEGKDKFQPVLNLLRQGSSVALRQRYQTLNIAGFVYLLRSGKYFKLGRTNATGRRLYELAIQLPQDPKVVHVIETDDPDGIEKYWHERFSEKRQGGEWFSLSKEEVAAFKRRRFQ